MLCYYPHPGERLKSSWNPTKKNLLRFPLWFSKRGTFYKHDKESSSTSSVATVKSAVWQLLALHNPFFWSFYQGKLNKKWPFRYYSGVREKLHLFISIIQHNYYAVEAAKTARLVKEIFSVVQQTLVSLLTFLLPKTSWKLCNNLRKCLYTWEKIFFQVVLWPFYNQISFWRLSWRIFRHT